MPSSLVGVVAQGDVAALQVASEDLEAHVPNLDHRTDTPYRGGAQDDAVAVAAHVHGVALREILVREELHRRFVCCLVVGHAGGHVSLHRSFRCFAGLLYASGFHPLPGTLCEILDGPQVLFLGLLGLSAASRSCSVASPVAVFSTTASRLDRASWRLVAASSAPIACCVSVMVLPSLVVYQRHGPQGIPRAGSLLAL